MTLNIDYIGCVCPSGEDVCIVVMSIIGQPLIYSAYPYSYPRQTNSYLTAVT